MIYSTLVTLHIIFAGIWISNLLADSFFRKQIITSKNSSDERKFINIYLKFINFLSSISATGILLTGILLVLNSGYGFFRMTDNHWLATKQILMVVLLLIIGIIIIPTAKKLRVSLGSDYESKNNLSDESRSLLKKLFNFNTIINIIVIINFLLAITHRYIG
jgi:amino acid permease